MGLNFPSAPAIGEIYPTPAQAGIPQWTWNGTTWKSGNIDTSNYVLRSGDSMSGVLIVNQVIYSANTSTTGYYHFGTSGTKYLNYDGINFNINGGSVLPAVNGTLNLGSAALRWGTIYTSDLSLKNEVGDWTIVEGEDDLFLYNNKRGTTYKFALTEVDPKILPPKKV